MKRTSLKRLPIRNLSPSIAILYTIVASNPACAACPGCQCCAMSSRPILIVVHPFLEGIRNPIIRNQEDVLSAEKAVGAALPPGRRPGRSEEHTSELQSRENLVCRLLL